MSWDVGIWNVVNDCIKAEGSLHESGTFFIVGVKSCRPRTRDSVRRASGFVQISIALIETKKGEAKAQACDIACLRKLALAGVHMEYRC